MKRVRPAIKSSRTNAHVQSIAALNRLDQPEGGARANATRDVGSARVARRRSHSSCPARRTPLTAPPAHLHQPWPNGLRWNIYRDRMRRDDLRVGARLIAGHSAMTFVGRRCIGPPEPRERCIGCTRDRGCGFRSHLHRATDVYCSGKTTAAPPLRPRIPHHMRRPLNWNLRCGHTATIAPRPVPEKGFRPLRRQRSYRHRPSEDWTIVRVGETETLRRTARLSRPG
jgi:hypothetical protein